MVGQNWLFLLTLFLSIAFFAPSSAQPYCGELEAVIAFDGSSPDQEQYSALLSSVQGTARSFNFRGAESARIGALQFSDRVVEEQDVLYYTEDSWRDFPNTPQVRGPKEIPLALQEAARFVQSPPNPRTQYIILMVTNIEANANAATDIANDIKNSGQRIVTIFIQDDQLFEAPALASLASPGLSFVWGNDSATYYDGVSMVARAICQDLNQVNAEQDECPSSFKIEGGMCGCDNYDVNGCALPECSLPSTFEDANAGTDGWMIINGEGVLSEPSLQTYQGPRNTFNSYLHATDLPDPAEGEEAVGRYFLAPSQYIGEQSQLFGGFLMFSLRLHLEESEQITSSWDRVIIEGQHKELFMDELPDESILEGNVWSHYSVPVVNSGTLLVRDKDTDVVRIALEEDVREVLRFVLSMRILIDYSSTYNAADFDNFMGCEVTELNNFEASDENWLVVDSEGLGVPSWGINFITYRDRTEGEEDNFYWVAPWAASVACVGTDLSYMNGGLIAYEASLLDTSAEYKMADDIVIVGQTKQLVYRLLPEEYPGLDITRISVPISERSGRWYVSPRMEEVTFNQPFPQVASAEDFEEVLSSASFFYIRGEYQTLVDYSLLHNALIIGEIQDNCGSPICNENGRCVSGTCQCNYGYKGEHCELQANCAAGKFQLSKFAA